MKIRLISKAQEQAEAEQDRKDIQAFVERGKYLGRCLTALRDARQYLDPKFSYGKIVCKSDLLAQINSLVGRGK
jgi:hypothetical protein